MREQSTQKECDSYKDWLKELRRRLRPHYSSEELVEILSDYETFFREGKQRGESTQELCADFGTPEQVAEELIAELPMEKRNQFSKGRQAGRWLSILLLAASAWGTLAILERNFYQFTGGRIVFAFMAYAAVFPVLCWFVLRIGNVTDCSELGNAKRSRRVLLVLQLCWYALFLLFSYVLLPHAVMNWMDERAGIRLTGVFHLLAVLAGVLTAVAAIGIRRGNHAMVCEVGIGFGQLAGLYWYLFSVNNYQSTQDAGDVIREFLRWMRGRNQLCVWAFFAFGMVLAILFAYRMKLERKQGERRKGGRNAWMHK